MTKMVHREKEMLLTKNQEYFIEMCENFQSHMAQLYSVILYILNNTVEHV